mmetsp:Transcript_966/g.849  ORF Transcript_966/g.849 Transcript_966/m.849 type:complete len:297 (+) Transcript_966:793-1683(+)
MVEFINDAVIGGAVSTLSIDLRKFPRPLPPSPRPEPPRPRVIDLPKGLPNFLRRLSASSSSSLESLLSSCGICVSSETADSKTSFNFFDILLGFLPRLRFDTPSTISSSLLIVVEFSDSLRILFSFGSSSLSLITDSTGAGASTGISVSTLISSSSTLCSSSSTSSSAGILSNSSADTTCPRTTLLPGLRPRLRPDDINGEESSGNEFELSGKKNPDNFNSFDFSVDLDVTLVASSRIKGSVDPLSSFFIVDCIESVMEVVDISNGSGLITFSINTVVSETACWFIELSLTRLTIP